MRGKLIAVSDNTDTVALGRFHGRKFAFCDTGYNAPDRDGAVFLVDIVPAQTHDLLTADTGVQQNGNRCAERTVKMRDNVCKLLGLVDFDVLERRIRLDLDAVTRIAAAQAVDNRAFHDLVNGDEDVVPGALAEVGGIAHHAKVRVEWIAAEEVTPENVREKLAGCSGVLVPGGFGERGLEGKIAAVQYARENNVPFLGICLGMQMAVVEYARHVLGLTGAHTSEVDPNTPYPVIDLMPDQQNIDEKGGTMRLGKYPCRLNHDSISYAAYGEENIFERHRHRYEFNNVYRDKFVESGMRIGGVNPDRDLVEIVELPNHPWFVGVQYHPELKSRPNRPHPLFREFVGAALAYQDK